MGPVRLQKKTTYIYKGQEVSMPVAGLRVFQSN